MRRRHFKRRFRRGKKSLAHKVAKIQKILKVDKPELKFEDVFTSLANNVLTTSPFDLYLGASINQGTDNAAKRDGNVISNLFMEVRGSMTMSSSSTFATQQTTWVRLLITKWDGSAGLAPVGFPTSSPSAIGTYAAGMTQNYFLCERQVNTSKQYKILYDRTYQMDLNARSGKNFHLRIPLKGNKSHFSSSAAAHPVEQLYVVSLISSAGTIATAPFINLFTRLGYYDV